ncbi:hypothetical protein FOBRF1_006849 [Fusarium oxysporum]
MTQHSRNASFSCTAETIVFNNDLGDGFKNGPITISAVQKSSIEFRKTSWQYTSFSSTTDTICGDDEPKAPPHSVAAKVVDDGDDVDPPEDRKQDGPTVSTTEKKVDETRTFTNNTVEACGYPEIEDPVNPARDLSKFDLRNQRMIFLSVIVLINGLMAVTAFFGKKSKLIFILVLFVKSKDFLSAILSPCGMICRWVYQKFRPPPDVKPLWILSLIPAYSESEEQIVKTIFSLRGNGVEPHRQVIVVILDGKPRDVRSHMTRMVRDFQRPYISLKFKRGVLNILAGFMDDVPVIVIEKVKNAGKKDSLILCHDLFNYPRDNSPPYTQLLRKEIWGDIIPKLTEGYEFNGFDQVFCTDADSTIYKGALALLANAIARNKNAIAACGLVLVELEPGYEWSFWNLYQQFQYTFGQYVRRRAEGFVGKVTCLPGCITMIAVRPEMAGAIRKYAEPITGYMVVNHQVQYLGTDRRLTYLMLSQGTHLETLFVSDAVSETVAPQSLMHYLSQRRRWGSNAYFNNWFYMAGEKMIPITRIAATVEVVRLSLVYYRVLNTVLFILSCIKHVSALKLIPMLVIGQLPSLWFFISILIEHELRRRGHKLVIGYFINKCVSPFMSVIIFTKVATNLGIWGMSGVTASSATAAETTEKSAAEDKPSVMDELSAAERGEAPLPKQDACGEVTKPPRAHISSGQAFDIE